LREDDPDGPINTDRPTFTPSKSEVPRGRLQFESGFTFNHSADNRSTHSIDGGLLFGLTPNRQIDLRAGFEVRGHSVDFFTGAGFSRRFRDCSAEGA
jgi:hypothetical protein